MNIQQEVLEFIKRRFKKDCDWTEGNCYYFAVILHSRFPYSTIMYDPLEGHFVCKIFDVLYDYNGVYESEEHVLSLSDIAQQDKLWYKRLVRDCVM